MEWIAYCTTCKKELDRTPNGPWAEAAARNHATDRAAITARLLRGEVVNAGEVIRTGHKVIVGYEV